MGMCQAGNCAPVQDGCIAPLAEHSLQEGSPALPFLQVLALGSGVLAASLYLCSSYQI